MNFSTMHFGTKKLDTQSSDNLKGPSISSIALEGVESKSNLSMRLSNLRSTSTLNLTALRYPQSDLLPPTPIRTWSSIPDLQPVRETYPSWLYPQVDWERESRWGHCFLKVFALMARLVATIYWIATDLLSVKSWPVLCLFYHACPGLLGVETSAILPYLLSPIPFRTVSWVHDIMGIVLGIASVSTIYFTSEETRVLLTLLTLTVIPLSVDLVLHLATIPRYVMAVY